MLIPLVFALVTLPLDQEPVQLEPWSDPALPVTASLAAWYDVRSQHAAFAARLLPRPRSGEAIGTVFDASGHRRHLLQHLAGAQPTYLGDRSLAILRFDGNDDAFEAARLDLKASDSSIFD